MTLKQPKVSSFFCFFFLFFFCCCCCWQWWQRFAVAVATAVVVAATAAAPVDDFDISVDFCTFAAVTTALDSIVLAIMLEWWEGWILALTAGERGAGRSWCFQRAKEERFLFGFDDIGSK